MPETDQPDVTALTVQLLSAYLANNTVPSGDLAELIRTTRTALMGETASVPPSEPEYVPAVSVKRSLASRDHLVSLIDGKPYKTLKRHLSSHGLTSAEYRARYGLPADYPMVAPSYSEHRRQVANRLGLGRKRTAASPVATAPEATPPEASAKPKPARKAKAADAVTATALPQATALSSAPAQEKSAPRSKARTGTAAKTETATPAAKARKARVKTDAASAADKPAVKAAAKPKAARVPRAKPAKPANESAVPAL